MLRINVVIRMWVIHATLPDCKNVRMRQARKMEMSSRECCKLQINYQISAEIQISTKNGTFLRYVTMCDCLKNVLILEKCIVVP